MNPTSDLEFDAEPPRYRCTACGNLTRFEVTVLRRTRAFHHFTVGGELSIEDAGWELFRLLLDVASGRKTWAEHWKLHNALVLFNPAPIT